MTCPQTILEHSRGLTFLKEGINSFTLSAHIGASVSKALIAPKEFTFKWAPILKSKLVRHTTHREPTGDTGETLCAAQAIPVVGNQQEYFLQTQTTVLETKPDQLQYYTVRNTDQ